MGVDLGKLCYEQTISTWVVKSDLLIGVKLSLGIRTPLYKETNIVPNDCCRICRIYVKISGRSKINVFGYNNILSAVYMTQRDYLSEVLAGSCKVCKSLSIALITLFTSAGRAVCVDSKHVF